LSFRLGNRNPVAMEGNAQEIRALRPMDSRSRIGVRDRPRIGVRDKLRGNDRANRRRTDLPGEIRRGGRSVELNAESEETEHFEDIETRRLQQVARLRMIVGFLGEKSQRNWWPSEFFSDTAPAFLNPVFGKTATLAQYHGVKEAARRVHDDHIGVGSVFHLFRLPDSIEQCLFELLQSSAVIDVLCKVGFNDIVIATKKRGGKAKGV
jgi:hypothetical protein